MSGGTVSTQFPSRTEFQPSLPQTNSRVNMSRHPEEKNRLAGKVEGLSQLLAVRSVSYPAPFLEVDSIPIAHQFCSPSDVPERG